MGAVRFDGVNDVISQSGASSVNAGTSPYAFRAKGAINALPSSGLVGIIGTSSNANSNGLALTSAGALRVYAAGTNRYGSADGLITAGVPFDFTVDHASGGAWTITNNITSTVVTSGTFTTSTTFAPLNQFGRSSSSSANYLSADMEIFAITSTPLTEVWDANLSGGTGSVLPTVSGNNNGTLVNFPTDNSQWVGFGATYVLTADGASWSYTGGAASTLFNRLLTADGVSFSYSGGVASTLYNRLLSADGASWQWQGGSAGLYYNRSMQADGAQWSYALADATLNYVTGSTVYTLIADGAQWAHSASDAALLFNRVIYADGQQFNYSGTDAATLYHRALSADGTNYQYQLPGAQTLYHRALLADGSGFSYAGGAATLLYSGAVIVSITSYTMAYEQAQASASYSAMPVSANYSKLTVSARYKDGVI